MLDRVFVSRTFLPLGRWSSAAILAGSLLALIAARQSTVGGPILVAEDGGPYRVLKFQRLRPLRGPRLVSVATIERPHAQAPQWILEQILIAPSGTLFAVEETELIAGSPGTDMAVTLVTLDGHSLFFTTDNGFPATSWAGTDPAAPLSVRQAQEIADQDWDEQLTVDPAAPRPIVSGRFSDDAGVGQIRVAGWLGNGDMALTGRAPMRLSHPGLDSYLSDDLEDWWGVVSPVSAGSGSGGGVDSWAFSARGAGPLPPAYPLSPPLSKQRNVSLQNGRILIDGSIEPGFAGILALDGPYRGVNG